MTADRLRRLRRRVSSRRARVVSVLAVIAILALCPFAWNTVEAYKFRAYHNTPNTSPPLSAQSGGVTLRVAHSHYLILDTIVVTLTNDSDAPIYLSKFPSLASPEGWVYTVECPSGQGWQPCPNGFGVKAMCPGGTTLLFPAPSVGAVAPGASITLASIDGNLLYPLLQAGDYRFSVTYSLTPTKNPDFTQWPPSTRVTLTTATMTLSSAWWIPPWKNAPLIPVCGHPA